MELLKKLTMPHFISVKCYNLTYNLFNLYCLVENLEFCKDSTLVLNRSFTYPGQVLENT